MTRPAARRLLAGRALAVGTLLDGPPRPSAATIDGGVIDHTISGSGASEAFGKGGGAFRAVAGQSGAEGGRQSAHSRRSSGRRAQSHHRPGPLE